MPYLTTGTALCKEKASACDRIQLGTLMRFMSSAGITILPHATCQHLVVAPRTPPSVSAREFIATFEKEENLSSVLPQVDTVAPPTLGGLSNIRRPRFANSGKDAKHAACGVLKKLYREMVQKWKEVPGLTGLM